MKKQNQLVKLQMAYLEAELSTKHHDHNGETCSFCWQPIHKDYCPSCETTSDRSNDLFLILNEN